MAVFESRNDFVRYCSSVEKRDDTPDLTELTRGMHCMGYIQGLSAGVDETITFATEKGYAVPVPFCIPDGVRNDEVVGSIPTSSTNLSITYRHPLTQFCPKLVQNNFQRWVPGLASLQHRCDRKDAEV